ncbi:MAG TPA: glycosyl hydrolase [Saprospiraceae bacterium]|nr:glycosyl hydrolase [Saprospiraceae bacterium]HNT21554.1 glycosyl hydrolase [Saprospiraceae bacterium]
MLSILSANKEVRGLSILLLFCFPFLAKSQIQWPEIGRDTRPWTRWWWQGSAVDTPGLKWAMKQYQEAGLGGLEITPIYGVQGHEARFIDYLSPQWMGVFDFVLREAKKLGLGIDMATGTGWPFGGPWIGEDQACKYLAHKKYQLREGQSLKDTIQYFQEGFVRTANGERLSVADVIYPITDNEDLQALAIDQVRHPVALPLIGLFAFNDLGQWMDLSQKVNKGLLEWTAPQGTWTLYALFQGLHGKMVERAAPGGEGNVIDHFDEAAVREYLSFFDRAFENTDLSGLRGFFNDSYEVDDARGQSDWTPRFFEEFNSRRGYDLKAHLPSLFSETPDEKSALVLYDYRETVSELVLEKFTRTWTHWGHQKNKWIRNQSHGSPANILDLYGAVDIPETEGTDLLRFKFASSAAHVLGKPLASAEAATWLHEHFISSLSDVRAAADQYFLGGVNHLVYHGTNYSPPNESWPGWLFYAAVHLNPANPAWKDFKALNDYISRCQAFLQKGNPDQDILLYFPFADRNQQLGNSVLHHFDGMQGFEGSIFKSAAEELIQSGYAWDLISDRQIQSLQCLNGKLIAPGGDYQTMVISGAEFMPIQTLFKIDSLIRKGAKIIFHVYPTHVPGFYLHEENQRLLDSLVNALQLKKNQAGKLYMDHGLGRVYKGPELQALLDAAEIRSEKAIYQKNLACIRRKTETGYYYFIKNTGDSELKDWLTVNASAASVLQFDPMKNQSGLARWKKTASGTEVWISLLPGETVILETTRQKIEGPSFPFFEPAGEAVDQDSGWNLKFISGGPALSESVRIDQLQDWTKLPLPGAPTFSGTASYSITFKLPSKRYDHYLLDLGTVFETAEIKLNDSVLATTIGPVHRVLFPSSLLKRTNTLEILVTNSMANRIIDLEKRGVPWKKFYNINFPARLAENRGPDGLFTAIHWDPRPSGLLGPVTLKPFNKAKE